MSKRSPKPNGTENRLVRALDDLAEFERYQEEVLPILRQAVLEGWTAERINSHPKIQAMVAARQVTIALFDKDSARAHSAITDLRNRAEGKPKEKLEVTSRVSKMSDDELDALLLSEVRTLDEDSGEPDERH